MSPKARLIALIIAAEAVPAWHSLEFWAAHGGTAGAAWAAALLIVTVWMWYALQGVARVATGVTCSALLLAGPLFQVAAPAFQTVAMRNADATANAARVAALQREIGELETAVSTYTRNSETRAGWWQPAETARARLQQAREALAEVLRSVPPVPWLAAVVTSIQLAALVLFHAAALVAVARFRVATRRETVEATYPAGLTLGPESFLAATPSPLTQTINVNVAQQTVANVSAASTKRSPLADRIAAGEWGDRPGVRKIIAATGLRHAAVSSAFAELIARGAARREGQGFVITERENQ